MASSGGIDAKRVAAENALAVRDRHPVTAPAARDAAGESGR
jgi:hypothetical protein